MIRFALIKDHSGLCKEWTWVRGYCIVQVRTDDGLNRSDFLKLSDYIIPLLKTFPCFLTTTIVKSNIFIVANSLIYIGTFLYLQLYLLPSQLHPLDLSQTGLISALCMGQACSQLRAFKFPILFA